MQTQLITSNNQLTMSSREIASLTSKQHDNVLKLIRSLIESGIVKNTTPQNYVHPQNKQTYTEFLSDKRDSLVIVARLSPEFTAAVIDRWQELESKNYYIPQTYAEALQLCADQAKEIELLNDKNKELSTSLKSASDTIQKNGDTMYYLARILHNREEDKKDIQDLYK